MTPTPDALETDLRTADISECGKYRYTLTRTWSEERGRVLFIMLNPSTADADKDDNTIRRCIAFARAWGYGGIEVVNLYALRAINPGNLLCHPDPVGPRNDDAICAALTRADLVVVAWGASYLKIKERERNCEVLHLIRSYFNALDHEASKPKCLNLTKEGHPQHPLYAKGDIVPRNYTTTFPHGSPNS
jgi:hypothetical protein